MALQSILLAFFAALPQDASADGTDCSSSPHFVAAGPHPAGQWKRFASILSPAQQRVIVMVLDEEHALGNVGGVSVNDRVLYFALPKGILTLWFGEAGYPTGEFPASLNRCGSAVTTACRLSYPVVGAPNIWYFPSRGGGMPGTPPAGLHWYEPYIASPGPIDHIAIEAYERNQIPSPWSETIEYFEGRC